MFVEEGKVAKSYLFYCLFSVYPACFCLFICRFLSLLKTNIGEGYLCLHQLCLITALFEFLIAL